MELNCTVCLDQLKYPVGKPDNCEHKFCFKCIDDWLKNRSQCPLCGKTPKYLIKIEENEHETKVPVKKRTAKQFENELLVREQLEEDHSESLDVTIEYASCRSCRRSDNEHLLLLCDGNVGQNADGSMIRCNVAYHSYCLPEKLEEIPKDEWFCPFCAKKPENEQNQAKQTRMNALCSDVGTSNSTVLKNARDVSQDWSYHSDGRSKQDEVKAETTECSSITNSESTAVHVGCGDSDVESESIESNSSDGNSELYSETDATADNCDDDYEGTDLDKMTESSNEITVDDSEVENTNESSSDVLLDDDDDKLDCSESDETDSEHKLNRPMFRSSCKRRKANCSGGRSAHTTAKVTGFMTKSRSKSGKTVTKYQGFILTRRHST